MRVIKEADFFNEIKEGLVLVDFYADWCGPCKMLSPILEQINNENMDIKIIKINIDNAFTLAGHYQISSIPALLLFKDGRFIKRLTGFYPKKQIEKFINEAK